MAGAERALPRGRGLRDQRRLRHGRLPDEAATVGDALRLADERMYAQKHRARRAGGHDRVRPKRPPAERTDGKPAVESIVSFARIVIASYARSARVQSGPARPLRTRPSRRRRL